MGRVIVSISLDGEVAETARALGLDMSRLAEATIMDAAKIERSRLWRIENEDAINAYAEEVAKVACHSFSFEASRVSLTWHSLISTA